jgi:septum site-determining protein MinC
MSAPHTQFELKAGTFTLPLLRLLGTDMDAMAEQLSNTVDQAESFFHNTPVVIDLKDIAEAKVEFPMLVGLMRGHGMIPVGVRGGTSAQHEAAEIMGLAVLADGRQSRTAPPALAAPVKQPLTEVSTTLVNRPIRSGQRIYAQGGDLVILGQVSSGAEVMADGHIHVYASLRGRALAGVKGNENARIFCRDLQAELISVAGHYRISENIDTRLRDQPVQIYLEERILRIETL